MDEKEQQIADWFAWRETERRKHRVMTLSEYRAWIVTGDSISHPSTTDAFPGGITIQFDARPGFIFGRTDSSSA